jgi:hypothetical protein
MLWAFFSLGLGPEAACRDAPFGLPISQDMWLYI